MLDKKKVKFRRKRQTDFDKRYRYSIRKFNVGIASVAIAAFMFLGNGAVSVSANELGAEVSENTSTSLETGELSQSSPDSSLVQENTEAEKPTETSLDSSVPTADQSQPVLTEVPETTGDSQQDQAAADDLAAAKKILEQVISEAEVLVSETLRLAAKQTEQAAVLEAVANETKAVAETANKVFADEHASLEEVNAQITAIRTSVDSLVREVRNQTDTEDIQVMLTTTTTTEGDEADDADKAAVTAISDVYTAKTQKVVNFTSIPNNAIVVIQSEATPTTYTYKRFEGAVNFSTIKQAYDANQFVAGKTELKENETIYVVKEADLKNSAEGTATNSIEESLDLTKFRHRENMLLYTYEGEDYGNQYYMGIRHGSPDNQFKMQLAALARPGSFTFGADLGSSTGYAKNRTLPKDNNGYLVVEPLTSRHYDEIIEAGEDPGAEYNPDYLADSYGLDWQYKLEKTNLFLSHIEGSNDTINQPNTIFGDLPPGVEVVFQKPDGTEAVTDADKDAVFKELAKQFYTTVFYDEDGSPVTYDGPVTYDEVGFPSYHYKGENQPPATLKFKFQVKKDGKVIQKDTDWRQTNIYQTSKDFTELIKTTTTNTANDFEKGIVDNVDYSALPQAMKVEAVNMEKASTNFDGTTPQDQTLPEYTKPTGKIGNQPRMYAWRTIDGVTVRDQHATFPFRVLPNVSNFFNASVEQAVREYIDYAGDMPDAKIDTRYTPEKHNDLIDFFKENFFQPLDGELSGLTPAQSTYNPSYWQMIAETPTIPSFDVVPADINLEALTITPSGQTYVVTHRFEKGKTVPANIELPAEISNRITDDKNYKEVPSGAIRKVNDKISTEPYEDPVNKGVWTFEKWSAESLSPNENNPAPEFVGTWSFTKFEDVVVEYIALKLDGTVDTSVTLKEKYTDSDDVLPGTLYNAAADETERPLSIPYEKDGHVITYEIVHEKTESYTNGQKDEQAKTRGDVPEGGALIKYYYKPTGIGSVKIVYKALKADGIAEDSAVHLRDDYMDKENEPAGTPYNVRQGDEQPASITYRKTDGSTIEYKLVADKSKFSYPDGTEYTAAQIGTDFATEDEFYSYQVEENQLITYTYYYQPDPPVTESKGSVKIVYKALNADGTTVDEAVTLRGDINDTVDAAVGTSWNAKETGVDHDNDIATALIDERPATLLTEATPDKASLQYKLVAEKTTVQKPTDNAPVLITADTDLEGQVAEGLTTITYYYKPVLGGVIVKYVNEANVEIAAQYTDTDLTTHLTSPVQSYDAAGKKADGQTDEKPLTLTGNDGKSYIFKEVKTGEGLSQPTGTLKEGTTTVVYVYSEKPKGSVLVRYKALDVATGSQEDNSVTLREDYLDTPLSYVDTAWSTVDKNVDHDKNQDTPPVDEQPTKFENINDKNYVLVKTVTQVPRQNTTSEATSGQVVEGQTVVTYYYAPVQTETDPTENKGSVVIEYRRLEDNKPIASAKDDRKDVVVSTTTNTKTFYVVDGQRTYLEGGENGVDTTVATPADQLTYNANETGEQPATINFRDTEAGETAEKTYHFVKHDETSADITGSVEAGKTKTVVYLYSPEQTETIRRDNTARVTVNYYKLGTSTPLQASYEDTPATKISETVTTNTYYLNANDERVPVGNLAVVTNPVDPAVTYNTTLTKADGTAERPTTLESGGTTYHLVETATTFTEGTGVSGTLTKDTVVNYYYAEVKEEEVSRTPITGKVLVHYKRASDKQELKGTYTDTPDTTVAYEVTKRSYYEDAQRVKHQVGENRTSREEVTPIPAYTVEGTTEVPRTLPYENTTYHYIGLETGSEPLKGNVVEGVTEVTLLYTPELSETKTTPTTGSVVVRYKLEGSETDATPDGFTLRDDYPDTTNVVVKNQTTTRYYYLDANNDKQTVREETAEPVPTNERYEITAAEAPEILVSEGKQYRKVRRSNVPESGLVPEGTTTITYYYAPIQGGVIVKYVNEAGAEIADDYTDTDLTTQLTDPVQTYDAAGKKADGQTDEKPSELVGKDGKTYVFKEVKSGDGLSQPTGNLKEGTTTVVYVYKEKDKGSVLVRYVALQEDGQTVDDTVHLADDYQDTPETYIGREWNTTGNKADGSLERPADFRNVNGKDYLLVKNKVTTTHDGQPVDNNPTSGQVQKGQTVVTYYYAPVPQGSVHIEYKALHPDGAVNTALNLRKVYFDTLNANVGTDYNASETGRVDHDDNPATPLEDEKPSQIVLGATTYRLVEARTTKRLNDGQDSLTDLTSGQVEKGTTTITYYYAPVLGQVIVKYKALNADGTAVDTSVHLADDYPEVTAGNVNEAYAITGQKPNSQEDEKPSTFVKAGKTYHLVASKTTKQVGTDPEAIVGDNHDGNVAEGTTLITFFYAPEQVEQGASRQVKGDVNIRYENTAGEEIKTSLPDTVQGLVATYTRPDRRFIKVDNQVTYLDEQGAETEVLSNLTYDATQVREGNVEEKPSIITHNDKKYHFIKLKDGSASETGTVTVETKTVTYVYALEQTDVQEADITGSVIVKYQKLADRSEIKGEFADTTDAKVGVKITSQNYYVDKDGVRQLVGTATETKELLSPAPTYTVEGDTEKPAIIDVNGINYHFVGIDETKSALTGDVIEGRKEVVLLYNPELVEKTPNTRKASVYVDYKILGTNEELQARYTDTNQEVIATSETTKRYYIKQDGREEVLENTTSPETLVNVLYDTTENNERPTILTKAGKEYHLVSNATLGATEGRLTGDVYVTYYYAEIKTETGQTEEKGKVLIRYEDTEGNTISPEKVDVEDVLVSTTPTTRRYYEDKSGAKHYIEDLQVGTKLPTNAQYDATEVREGGVEEKPSIITHNDKNYHFIKLKNDSASETGTVTVDTKTVTYVYSPEVTVPTSSDNSAKVTVNYYILGTSTTLQPSYEDTPSTKISETVSTRTYYLGADGKEVPVGEPTVVTNPVDPAVTYNTTETKNGKEERPTTLESGGTTYHLVEAATTFTEGTGVSGTLTKDTVVNYYYAEVKEEVVSETTNGSVTIKYETTDGTPIRGDKEDTASTVISTKTTTKKYYEHNGQKFYIGDVVVVTTPVEVSYDTTEKDKDEKPETLSKDGKIYKLVAVKDDSAPETGTVTGDHVVTYVYAPEEPTPPN
ncbi:TPA: YSIRK-type signal peptide-containing protein, partial [Streptococcus suis]